MPCPPTWHCDWVSVKQTLHKKVFRRIPIKTPNISNMSLIVKFLVLSLHTSNESEKVQSLELQQRNLMISTYFSQWQKIKWFSKIIYKSLCRFLDCSKNWICDGERETVPRWGVCWRFTSITTINQIRILNRINFQIQFQNEGLSLLVSKFTIGTEIFDFAILDWTVGIWDSK